MKSAAPKPVIDGVLATPVHEHPPAGVAGNSRWSRLSTEIRQEGARPSGASWRKEAGSRDEALAAALDEALDQWWQANIVPPPALLRDGLLALQAGQDLHEGHRTLLLRAALSHRKGMLTALRHQTDPERTASILKEVILDMRAPLAPDLLWRLLAEDAQSQAWTPLLLHELKDEARTGHGPQQQLAGQALSVVQGKQPPAQTRLPLPGVNSRQLAGTYWSPGRWLILVLFVVAVLIGVGMYWGQTPRMRMVTIPAGAYVIGDAEESGGVRTVQLAAFAIDRTEVTNQQYGQCVSAGECPPPASVASARHADYVTNPLYASHPVIYVDWDGARRYCDRLVKRLPTADEWEVAASIAPATQQRRSYPWGEQFDSRLANTQVGGHGDTQPVGSYHPTGDSPFGVMDMAGNVAEWTSTPALEGGERYVVKGGSFRDEPAGVRTDVRQNVEGQTTADWLGFRCVADR